MGEPESCEAQHASFDGLYSAPDAGARLGLQWQRALLKLWKRGLTIPTSELNEEFLPIVKDQPPPIYKGKSVSIKYITQLPSQVPTFAFYCNLPQYIKEPYKRFLENRFRERYDFSGVPIRLFFRKK